jgi:hypothetical protein
MRARAARQTSNAVPILEMQAAESTATLPVSKGGMHAFSDRCIRMHSDACAGQSGPTVLQSVFPRFNGFSPIDGCATNLLSISTTNFFSVSPRIFSLKIGVGFLLFFLSF